MTASLELARAFVSGVWLLAHDLYVNNQKSHTNSMAALAPYVPRSWTPPLDTISNITFNTTIKFEEQYSLDTALWL
jgi:hypothetical protein